MDWDVLLLDGARFLDLLGSLQGVSAVLMEARAAAEPGFAKTVTNSMLYMEAGNPLAPAFLDQIATDFRAAGPGEQPRTYRPVKSPPCAASITARPDLVEHARFLDLREVYSLGSLT